MKEPHPDGNDFHYKVKSALETAGWTARMSPYYNDIVTEKPREIDIIAEKAFLSVPNNIYTGGIIVRLFVECKYINNETTFWFQKRDDGKARKALASISAFHDPNGNYLVAQGHHYLSDKLIAKLYQTEGKSQDSDPIYKAINQCLHATIYFRNQPTELSGEYNHQSLQTLNYPIIMCNSFEKFIGKNTTNDYIDTITDPFQLEIDYAYTAKGRGLEELFYIDVLNIGKFGDFESGVLSKEADLARQKLSDDRREAEWQSRVARSERGDYNPFDFG